MNIVLSNLVLQWTATMYTGHWRQDTGHNGLDNRYWLITKDYILHTVYSTLDTRYWILIVLVFSLMVMIRKSPSLHDPSHMIIESYSANLFGVEWTLPSDYDNILPHQSVWVK